MGLSRHIVGLLGVGVAASAALAATGFTALGGFSATVENNSGAAGSGTLLLSEGSSGVTCISTGSGTTSSTSITSNDNPTCPINLFSDTNLEPLGSPNGATQSATVTLTNPGSLPGSTLSLTPGSCTVSNNTSPGGNANTYFGTDTSGFCGLLDITIENDTTSGSPACVFPAGSGACPTPTSAHTLASLTSFTGLPGLAANGGTATYKVTIGLDSAATNADQGLLATVPLTWTLAQ